MADWRQSLAGVDEDYLVGISNKGIVKRAYKDLEAEGEKARNAVANLDWTAPELAVAAGGEEVVIRLPLGESRCSCPSRSICRHVVMAILLARQAALGGGGDTGQPGAGDSSVHAAAAGNSGVRAAEEAGDSGVDAAENMGNSGIRAAEEAGNSGGSCPAEDSDNSGGHAAENIDNSGNSRKAENSPDSGFGDLAQRAWQEILAQPRKPLLRALGSRGLRRLAAEMEAGQFPQMERGTVVRMQLPGQDMTVKLLSPLEYSTCSCHRKELCSHKAEAILWCQYLEKQLTAEELARELEQQPAFDLRELSEGAGQIRDCLEHLLETGLARSSAEQAQELERLAILCHNAGLPGWEGDLRAMAEGYEKYLRRAAGQTMERLAGQLQQLYHKTLQLGELADKALSDTAPNEAEQPRQTAATDETEQSRLSAVPGGTEQPQQPQAHFGNIISRIQALAGEFRSEYRPVGELELMGITVEHFISDAGYEGDTVYFLDTAAQTWYTYTNARPTFYEGKKRSAYQEKARAPWGISMPLEGLARVRLRLRGAKCDDGGRLSSSQETRGEILGKSELTASGLEGWYYREYDRLFAEQIPMPGRKSQPDKAVGRAGRNVSEDSMGRPRLVFVQAARFERGRFNEITQKLELPIWDKAGRQVLVELPYSRRDEASIRYLERLEKRQKPCFLGRVYLRDSRVCLYPVDLLERQELEQIESSQEKGSDSDGGAVSAATAHSPAACQALQSYLEEVGWLLQEIYQAGAATVQDSTLETIKQAEKQGMAYGMTALSDWLRQLGELLSQSRHRISRQSTQMMKVYCELWRYVRLCRQRTAYDLACLSYNSGER